MKKNMIASLISHIVIAVISYVSAMPIYLCKRDDGTFETDNKFLIFVLYVLLVLLFLLTLFLYYYAGRKFLKLLENSKLGFLSVWYLSIALLIINGIASALDYFFEYYVIMDVVAFTFVYPMVMMFGLGLQIPSTHFDLFAACVLPSLLLWLGMLSNRKKRSSRKERTNF